MKVFEIKGEFHIRGQKRKFTKRVKADSYKFAVEKTLCLMGGKHKVKRRQIIISEVKEMGEENGGKKAD